LIVGSAQVRLFPDVRRNIKCIKRWIAEASDRGVEILNFPEASVSGYIYDAFLQLSEEDVKRCVEEIRETSEKLGVSVVVGSPCWQDGRRYNSVAVLLADGRQYFYHKNNLVSYENKYFSAGHEHLVFEMNGLTFSTIICRDQSFPEMARRSKEAGAQILFISCAHFYVPNEALLKIDKNRALPIARASENQLFVFLANAIGTIQGRISLGKSMIVGPNGVVLSEAGGTQEELLAIDIDPSFDWSW
jgi:predicted amidohydrolase